MIRYWRKCLLVLAIYGGCAAAQAGRGELLYLTYCNGCHTERLHWRDKQVAQNWESLVEEVRRWQANGNLDWSDDDVELAARYLNDLYYHFPLSKK
jgi:hypothetical protein